MTDDAIKAEVIAFQNATTKRQADKHFENVAKGIHGYISCVIRKHNIFGYESSDLRQVALLGIFKAMQQRGIVRDTPFRCFAGLVADRRIRDIYGPVSKRPHLKQASDGFWHHRKLWVHDNPLLRLAIQEEYDLFRAAQNRPAAPKREIQVQRLSDGCIFPNLKAAADAIRRSRKQLEIAIRNRRTCAGSKWQWVESAKVLDKVA